MKKTIRLISAILLLIVGGISISANQPHVPAVHITGEWLKSKTGIWEGKADRKKHWYKLDKQVKLWTSINGGKDWVISDTQMWADLDGKWIKISDNELIWSVDMGKTWAPVPDRTWEAANGKWYKLDKSMKLWVNL